MGLPTSYNMWDSQLGNVLLNAQALAAIVAAGNQWFVDEATGSDTNPGTSEAPFATLTAALAAAVPNNGDIVYLIGTVHVTGTVAWNKDNVSLIGITAPSNNCRARISQTGSTVFSPLVNVTGQGCKFIDIGTFHGFNNASAQVCWAEAGGRNLYQNVQFFGGGDATAAAQAGMRSLTVAGNGENLFVGCTIGLDTITRATNANASLEFLSGTPRNVFVDCTFQALVSDASDVHITVGAAGMDRYALFKRCAFMNAIDSTGTAMSAAVTANASAGGSIVFDPECVFLGANAVATTGPVYVAGPVPTATTSNRAVAAT